MAETVTKQPNVINPERFAFVLLALGVSAAAFGYWLLTSEIWSFQDRCGTALGGPDWWDGHPCHGRRGPRLGWGLGFLCLAAWFLSRSARSRWGKGWLWLDDGAEASTE